MSLKTKTYSPMPGTYTVTDGGISYSRILKVKREGTGYNVIISGTPSNGQVLYTSATGTLTFNIAFNGDPTGASDLTEKIYVLYDN